MPIEQTQKFIIRWLTAAPNWKKMCHSMGNYKTDIYLYINIKSIVKVTYWYMFLWIIIHHVQKKEAKHRKTHTLGFLLYKTQDQLEWCLLSWLGIYKKTIPGGFLEVARKCVLISECSYQVEHTGKKLHGSGKWIHVATVFLNEHISENI